MLSRGTWKLEAVKTDKISKLGVYTLQIGLEDRFHKGQDNRTNIPKPLSQRVSQEMLLQRTTQTTPKPTCTHNNEPSLYNLSLYADKWPPLLRTMNLSPVAYALTYLSIRAP